MRTLPKSARSDSTSGHDRPPSEDGFGDADADGIPDCLDDEIFHLDERGCSGLVGCGGAWDPALALLLIPGFLRRRRS